MTILGIRYLIVSRLGVLSNLSPVNITSYGQAPEQPKVAGRGISLDPICFVRGFMLQSYGNS